MADLTSAADLRVRSAEELSAFVAEKADELLRLRFQYATGQLENVRRIKQVKTEVARAKTVMSQRANNPSETPAEAQE